MESKIHEQSLGKSSAAQAKNLGSERPELPLLPFTTSLNLNFFLCKVEIFVTGTVQEKTNLDLVRTGFT